MKFTLLFLSFSLSLLTLAQTPKTISYQGIARNATGQPITNQSIKVKLSLLETATSSNSLYTETHSPTTTGQGLFALQIGAGTVMSGTYSTLDWSNGPKFVKTEIDPTGGDNFTLSSTNPLNAVPFALFAASGTPGPRGLKGDTGARGPIGPQGTFPTGNTVGDMQYWNGTEWTMIPKGQTGTTLKNCDGQITWNPCSPRLTTTNFNPITSISYSVGGNISNDGDSPILARGICWNTNPNPTISNFKTIDGFGTGPFLGTLTNLLLSTTYYARAYATNSIGTSYGNQITFITPNGVFIEGQGTSDIDGNNYNSIILGTQEWMKENLKVTKFSNGQPIPLIASVTDWNSLDSGAFSYYSNLQNNQSVFGNLYNGYCVIDSRNVCPTGWHVPTNLDWTVLENYLGGISSCGGKLKLSGVSIWNSPNTGADNSSGFSGLPGGYRLDNGNINNLGFIGIDQNGFWWTSSAFDLNNNWYRQLTSYSNEITVGNGGGRKLGMSIRCIKN